MFLFAVNDKMQALGGLSNSGTINVNQASSSIDPPFLNNLGTINIAANSTIVVGTGSPTGTGYIQLPNGHTQRDDQLDELRHRWTEHSISYCRRISLAVGSMYQFPLFTPGQRNGLFGNIQNDSFNNGSEMWLVNYDNANGFVETTAETHATPEPVTLLLLMPGLLDAAYRLRRKGS